MPAIPFYYKFLTKAPLIKGFWPDETEELSIYTEADMTIVPVIRITGYTGSALVNTTVYLPEITTVNNRFSINLGKLITYSGTLIDLSQYWTRIRKFEVWAEKSSVRVTEVRTFTAKLNNKPSTAVRLSWLNTLGGIDHYTFDANRRDAVSIDRSTFRSGNPSQGVHGRSLSLAQILSSEFVEIFSSFEPDAECQWLKDLFISPEVFIVDSMGALTPVVITQSDVTYKDDYLVQFKVTLKKSFDAVIQNG